MLQEQSYEEYVKLAKHYLAIGAEKQYLMGDEEKPWHLATECEPGGSHRLDISTSVRFAGKHSCGLVFSWSFDIEPRSANGSGSYEIDIEAIQRVLAKLVHYSARKGFLDYLLDCAEKVEKRADEYQQEAKKQYAAANALRVSAKDELVTT